MLWYSSLQVCLLWPIYETSQLLQLILYLTQNKQKDHNECGIKTVYKSMHQLKHVIYYNLKNKIKLNNKNYLIYKINCNDCDVLYI